MENINLFVLRLILASVILGVVAAKKSKERVDIAHKTELSTFAIEDVRKQQEFYLKPKLDTPKHPTKNKRRNDTKKTKKSKRDAYGNNRGSWSARSSNFGYGEYSSNLPLYLVYNTKVGAYYPFYKYPKESYNRRSGNVRRVPEQ